MTTAGNNITKANITASMEALKSFNNDIVWHSGNHLFQTDITGGDDTGYATQNYADEISDTNVTASTITLNFIAYARLLSRIRNVNLKKWYQIQGDPRAQLNLDGSNITNLNSNYDAVAAGVSLNGTTPPASEGTISASELDAFVASLSNAIQTNRDNTVLVEEFYCHSNCHGSCHGSL
jgi:hypothetical protein